MTKTFSGMPVRTATGTGCRPFRRRLAATFLSALLVFQPALLQAQQITPDAGAPHANQPAIGAAPNGVPLVDIVTPNAQGLSHNKYDSLSVDTQGAILNNHNSELGTSQLGGITPGNPNLRSSGPASVILNEVTSSNRSQLNGAIEIFGGRADLVIANPNGITCDGCGFINTPRMTLTTGKPDIVGGRLSGFTVEGGDVTFGSKGGNFAADPGKVDLFDVVSRSVHVDGAVYGKNLRLTAGRNKYNYADGQATALAGTSGTPEFAIGPLNLGSPLTGPMPGLSQQLGNMSMTGINPGGGLGSGHTNWISEQSGLISKGKMDVDVAGNTHLDAGKIISQSGDLAKTDPPAWAWTSAVRGILVRRSPALHRVWAISWQPHPRCILQRNPATAQ